MPLYEAEFPVGRSVLIADRHVLEEFRKAWKHHHPLSRRQLKVAGRRAYVEEIYYYHGGDVLYELSGVPGIWHECCLAKLP